MTGDVRRDRLRGDRRLSLADDPDLVVDVVRGADRAPQRDLLRRIAADDRVFHVEVRVRDRELGRSLHFHAALRVFGQQPVLRIHHARRERARHVDDVELRAREHQEARIVFLDDRHLDRSDLRQALARHRRSHRLRRGIGIRRRGRKDDLAEIRIGLEDDLLSAQPLLQPIRVAADRVVHRAAVLVGVALDHLPRDDAQRGAVQVGKQRVVGLDELQLQRVTVDGAQSFDLGVVIEAAGRLRLFGRGIDPDELAANEVGVRRADARVDEPLPAVDDVRRGHLALPAVEGGIVGESNAWLEPDGPRAPVRRILGHRGGEARRERVRPLEIVPVVERVEDPRFDRVRVDVLRGRRVESRHIDLERRPQRLRRIGPRRGAAARGGDERPREKATKKPAQGRALLHARRGANCWSPPQPSARAPALSPWQLPVSPLSAQTPGRPWPAAGTFVAAGAGVEASCDGGVAEADEESMYSQAKPGAAASPNSVSVVAANSRFMIASSRSATS